MTIYDILRLAGKAFPCAKTPINILFSLRVIGIYPLDRNILTDAEYLHSDVTVRLVTIVVSDVIEDYPISFINPEDCNQPYSSYLDVLKPEDI